MEKVSIIVPVYNVAYYLETCLSSLTHQSYSNIEIILINDGSTDESETICQEWEQKDRRIKYFSQSNKGLSRTRNKGVELAQGDFLAFVDSDDWVSEFFVERMLDEITKNNSEIAICDYYKVDKNNQKRYVSCNSKSHSFFSKEQYLLLSNSASWNKLIRKDFWIKNDLYFVNEVSEDTAIFPWLILLSKSIASVNEPLYFYRKNRIGSITDDVDKRKNYSKAYQLSINFLIKKNILDQYKDCLYKYYLKWTSNSLSPCIGRVNFDTYLNIRQTFLGFLNNNFDNQYRNALIIGSYNLSRIVKMTSLFSDPYLRFQYSTICGLMSDSSNLCKLNDNYDYRSFMANRELANDFIRVLNEERPQFVVLDLVEERYSLLAREENVCTYNEIVKASNLEAEKSVIISNSFSRMWKECIKRLFQEISNIVMPSHVIVVENYLATRHYKEGKAQDYQNIKELYETNRVLKQKYGYIKTKYPEIKFIDYIEDCLYITDEFYEYGLYPWHLNDDINYRIANKLEEYLSKEI